MNQIDADAQVLSEDTEIDDQMVSGNSRFVPVNKAIHYRKRAQSAEKKIEELTEQLNQAKSQSANLEQQLNEINVEHKLTRKLACAGAADIETALLVAKTKAAGNSDADLDGIIEQLKKEKQFLFNSSFKSEPLASQKTASAKENPASSNSTLERAAKKAAVSGSVTDLQQYLKLRRNFV